jgi:hypothetical protein
MLTARKGQECIVRRDRPIDPALESKRLYIEHLAERLESMEVGRTPMKAIAYRLFSRRLREAMAGYPEAQLVARLSRPYAAVVDALATRFFDTHGLLPAAGGEAVRAAAERVLRRMRTPAV